VNSHSSGVRKPSESELLDALESARPSVAPVKKYLVRPGHVTSFEDGDRHWISAPALIRLYNVDPHECVIDGQDMASPRLRGYNQGFLDSSMGPRTRLRRQLRRPEARP
jgi:hypothetical protein